MAGVRACRRGAVAGQLERMGGWFGLPGAGLRAVAGRARRSPAAAPAGALDFWTSTDLGCRGFRGRCPVREPVPGRLRRAGARFRARSGSRPPAEAAGSGRRLAGRSNSARGSERAVSGLPGPGPGCPACGLFFRLRRGSRMRCRSRCSRSSFSSRFRSDLPTERRAGLTAVSPARTSSSPRCGSVSRPRTNADARRADGLLSFGRSQFAASADSWPGRPPPGATLRDGGTLGARDSNRPTPTRRSPSGGSRKPALRRPAPAGSAVRLGSQGASSRQPPAPAPSRRWCA